MRRLILVLTVLSVLVSCVFAQWTDDPAVNTTVCSRTGDQTDSKVATLSDDGFYVSWYDNNSGNYDVFLQRYDAAGNALWQENGICVSSHTTLSWITDYSMFVDSNDNAIVAFNDARDGGDFDAFVYKISPTGEFLWGDDGIQLCANETMDAFPVGAELSDGSFIIAWNHEGSTGMNINMNRISADGTIMWDNNLEVQGINGTTDDPNIIPNDNGQFILFFADNTGAAWAPTRRLYARLYNNDGTEVWNLAAVINEIGGFSRWTHPVVIPDGTGGFICTWYDDQQNTNRPTARVQRIAADGTVMFAANGLELSPALSENNYNPYPVFLPDSNKVMVFWETTNSNQSSWGIRAQLINVDGEKEWEDAGEVLVPLNPDRPTASLSACYSDDSGIVVWQETQGNGGQVDHIKAMKINQNHVNVWDDILTVSNSANSKMKMKSASNSLGMLCLSWVGGDDLYAQNINTDGTLGEFVVPDPELTITSPADDESFLQLPISIEFDLANFVMDETTPANGDGVIKIELDGSFLCEYAGASPYVLDAITEGGHTLTMTLIDGPDGNPLDPTVTDAVTFSYNLPAIDITSPSEGTNFATLPISFEFTLTNFVMNETTPADGDGVIEITLDDNFLMEYTGASPLVLETLTEGDHVLKMTLIDGPDGEPFDPTATDQVSFTYQVNGVNDGLTNLPSEFTLEGNYPNPFNAQTSIKFGLPETSNVQMAIYSITGQKVKSFEMHQMSAGWHTITWNAMDLSSGVYFIRMNTNNSVFSHKMILVK